MAEQSTNKKKQWYEKISRSGYFFGALLFHLVVFVMVATWVIFPAFHPLTEEVTKTYLLPPSQPPPATPPTEPNVQLPAQPAPAATTIIKPTGTPPYTVPMPTVTPATTLAKGPQPAPQKIPVKPTTISPERVVLIKALLEAAGRTPQDISESNNDPRRIKATFQVYLASYANGDWDCNVHMTDGKIDAGSLPDLLAKITEWSHGNITAAVVPTPLNIGGPDLIDKKPPFIFFTGHKDFVLTDQEIKNLQAYLLIGGLIWGDNAMAGRGSRFDVAFRREMKRVVPDLDKNFEPVQMDDPIFTKSWFPIAKIPQGMNYYSESLEHLDLDGKLAILYTPNDYSDMFSMRILPGDTQMEGTVVNIKAVPVSPLFTNGTFWYNKTLFFRNYELPSCLACNRLGMNIIGYLLVRFDQDMLLATP